jgi:hypothetical protein
MLELARRKDPKGDFPVIAEILAKTNEIMADAIWQEANGASYHEYIQRATLPAGTWRQINGGVAAEASKTNKKTAGIGMLEAYAEVDKKLIELSPNPNAFRMSEAKAFIEGMGQTMAEQIFYGSVAADGVETFDGLATLMGSLSATTNVIGAGGTGSDLTSVYVINWSEAGVYMVYPKGSKTGGVHRTDLGEQTKTLSSGAMLQIYRDHFMIHGGLVVADTRYAGRIANIETSGSSNIFNPDDLITLLNRMPGRGAGATIYCNSTIFTQLDIQAKDKTNVNYGPADAFGRPTVTFRGHPVRLCEAILDTESAIS